MTSAGTQKHGRVWCHIGAQLLRIGKDFVTNLQLKNSNIFRNKTKLTDVHQDLLSATMLDRQVHTRTAKIW
jgi:hypothetical protein